IALATYPSSTICMYGTIRVLIKVVLYSEEDALFASSARLNIAHFTLEKIRSLKDSKNDAWEQMTFTGSVQRYSL
ncbi:hypothetical protein ACJ73_03920, partial [Blastomyces percursus]